MFLIRAISPQVHRDCRVPLFRPQDGPFLKCFSTATVDQDNSRKVFIKTSVALQSTRSGIICEYPRRASLVREPLIDQPNSGITANNPVSRYLVNTRHIPY